MRFALLYGYLHVNIVQLSVILGWSQLIPVLSILVKLLYEYLFSDMRLCMSFAIRMCFPL